MATTIIGVDCATQAQKTGLAVGLWDGTAVSVQQATLGQRGHSIAQTITNWLPQNGRVLLAIDAPLGWPAPLGTNLAPHRAGAPLKPTANALFRRETDRFIWQTTGKLPLDVGADRIARTAHTALQLLDDLRQLTNQDIPLAWQPEEPAPIRAIEVYPAATLKQIFDPEKVPSYKGDAGANGRENILHRVSQHMSLHIPFNLLEQNDNVLDAAICILSGADFLRNQTYPPANIATAKKEGWIWVRQTGDTHD